MSDPLLIYGATGYTGGLITAAAVALGLRPVLCGRNEAKLIVAAAPFGLEYRMAAITEPDRLAAVLCGIELVLHAAGPFSGTSRPMIDACLRTGTHYLDITGEVPVLEGLVRRDADARARQIMIMPAVGFDVVPSDCLAAHVASRLRTASRLLIGLSGLRFATRGSAKTLAEHAGYGVLVRRDGLITPVPPGALSRVFDYGAGPRSSLNISWGDVSSAFYTTGIPNIEVYFEATPLLRAMLMASRYLGGILSTPLWQAWLKACADMLPERDSEAERHRSGDRTPGTARRSGSRFPNARSPLRTRLRPLTSRRLPRRPGVTTRGPPCRKVFPSIRKSDRAARDPKWGRLASQAHVRSPSELRS
jgi:short subunit dehydrogenase-like uncharacterized protein